MILHSSKTLSARKLPVVRVMVFGTFDGLHLGHEHFFKQARALAKTGRPALIVSVARDRNVLRIKGQQPQLGERQRLALIKKHSLVDKALLGGLDDYLSHIVKA